MKPSRKLEKAHTTIALEHCNTGLQLDKANARIAELTAEVVRLRETLMQIANGYVVETQSVQCIARNALKEGL